MKKILLLFFCIALLLVFVGCDTKEIPNEDKEVEDGKIKITFNLLGGHIISGETTVSIDKGNAISILMTPDVQKENCTFFGWAYDTEGYSEWTQSDVFFEDATLYAIWVSDAVNSGNGATNSSGGTTDTSNTGTTDTSNPGTTDSSNTGTTDSSNTGTTDTSNTGTTDSSNPGTTDSSNPGTTDTSNPGTTDTSNPGTTDTSNPGTTDASNPGTTDSSNPGTTDSSNPGTTDTSNPGTTDTSNPGTTDSSGSGGTTSSTTRPTGPVIVPDRTQYKPDVLGNKEGIYYAMDLIRHPILTPYYNGYSAALTMTFDDGYHPQTGTNVSDVFEKFGFRGTMMLGVCFINDESILKAWSDVFARGYLDLGCHGYDHKAPSQLPTSEFEHEIKDAIMFLREKFPGQRVLTFATPLAQITDAYEDYLSQFVIGNRLEAGGSSVSFAESLDYNPYRVKAISFNVRTNMTELRSTIESGVKNGRWIVELCHCVTDGANGVDVERTVFESHCQWLYRNYRDLIWITTFEDVLVYGEQLKHTSIDYTDCNRESMVFTVTPDGTLDRELYKIPMSIKVYLPEFTDSAYATVSGVYQPLEVIIDKTTGEKYTIVRDISATEQSEIVVYLGANKTMKNNCVHNYFVADTIEPTHDEGGYTLNQCAKCEHTYKSAYTNPVHDYSGDEEVVIEAILTQRGLKKHYCTQCDKYEVREFRYEEPTD